MREPRYHIEFALPPSTPQKLKGDVFEALVQIYLHQQSYRVTRNIRHVGGEVDLLCVHELSGRTIVAECKSQKDVIQSNAVDSLYTDVDVHNADEGWLVSISALGKEAKGKLQVIQEKYPKRFSHVDVTNLVNHCIRAGAISDPSGFLHSHPTLSDEIILILTESDRFYCLEHRSSDGQIIEGYSLVRAADLRPIKTETTLAHISTCLDRYSEAHWTDLESADQSDRSLEFSASQPVVELTAGVDWKDYRPSRPEDFIGREVAVDDLKSFIELVRLDNTNTRLFGVKARSGWGKSSLILKAAHDINATVPQCYFFAVDCRAAVSSDYGQLSISQALSNARARGVEFWGLPSALPASATPFEQPEVQNGLRALANSGGLIVVVFDQFEEIIHSANKALFAKLESLCYQIDSQKLPILLGFSWRTDAMVSADNPGYSLWHRLSDRRHDIELKAFTSADARIYVDRAERNANAKLAAKDRRFLLDNYVGLPWLLKKMTIHLLTADSSDTTEGAPDGTAAIARLFERDLQELAPEEHACLRAVGETSPKPLHALNLEFSTELVTGLIEKRLLINAGGQISLYSDIFRDYLLYRRLPFIPNTYCPSISATKLAVAVALLCRKKQLSYSRLADALRVAVTSADNVARDLQQMGIAKLERAAGKMTSAVATPSEATKKFIEFLRRHIILQPVLSADDEGMALEEIVTAAIRSYRFAEISQNTIEQYCSQLLRLAMAVGLIEKSATLFFPSRPIRDITIEKLKAVRVKQRADGFMGQAPPQSVLKALHLVRDGKDSLAMMKALGLRNAVFAATSLHLIERNGDRLRLLSDVSSIDELLELAGENQFVAFARETLATTPGMSGSELGLQLAKEYNLNLHPSSLSRYGNALRRWAL